jgi:hypothetical protein
MEPLDITYHLTSVAGILALIGPYLLGVWARTYAFPADQSVDMKRLLVGALPVAILAMTAYAKTSFAALESSLVEDPRSISFDVMIMVGYAICFGMLSREGLEKLLQITNSTMHDVGELGLGSQATRDATKNQ